MFKTPGKLRGKTPRTARKRNPLEVRAVSRYCAGLDRELMDYSPSPIFSLRHRDRMEVRCDRFITSARLRSLRSQRMWWKHQHQRRSHRRQSLCLRELATIYSRIRDIMVVKQLPCLSRRKPLSHSRSSGARRERLRRLILLWRLMCNRRNGEQQRVHISRRRRSKRSR